MATSELAQNTIATTIVKTERPNSYEFGKAGNRFKIYFEDAKNLKQQIEDLKSLGFPVDED